MLSAQSGVRFAVLLAFVCHAQALDPSHHNNRIANHGFGNESWCSWNCSVTNFDLLEETKITIAKGKLIHLVVNYENKVDDKCLNQTFRNSSGNATEHWQMWLANKKRSTFVIIESAKNLMLNTDSNEERKEIGVLCTLGPLEATATNPVYKRGMHFPLLFRGHLAAFGLEQNLTDSNTEEKPGNLEPCNNITNATDSNSTDYKSPFERGGWPVAVLYGFCFVFLAVFLHYSLAFLCFLTPTEVIEGGIHNIVLEGASPVSFGSRIGNYFFSAEDDGTIWHKARKFTFRVVILPLPFLCLGIQFYLKTRSSLKNTFFDGLFIPVCCVCYFINAFYISFFTMTSVRAKPCSVCKYVKPKIFSCQDELPILIIGHLRLQPLILVKSWQLFTQCMLRYFKIALVLFPRDKVSALAFLLRLFILIIFLITVPIVTVILSIMILLLAFLGIGFSSPIVMLCNARFSAINVPYFVVWTVRYCIRSIATVGLVVLILFAGIGTLLALISVMVFLVSEESLPYLACIVLVLYYVWSSYNSFTNKYQDLALTLFEHYKKSQSDKFLVMDANTDQAQSNITVYFEDDEMKIPKKLFYIACEELMPIREGVCTMLLKITILVSFVFLVFSIAILRSGGATPVMKALLAFLTALLPKILAIYTDGERQKKIKALSTNQKISKIMQEYIKQRNRTIGTSFSSNQAQANCNTDGDEEIFLHTNEENTMLVNI